MNNSDNWKELEKNISAIIQQFDNKEREGLVDTPRRYIEFLKEFLTPPEFKMTTFNNENYDEMVLVKDIPFNSLCEHHLMPFHGTAHIAYIPYKKIIGLSKLPRALEKYSRRFQNQERITNQVAEFLFKELHPLGVAVVIEACHSCISMRGVKKHGTTTVTSKMIGVFKDDSSCRAEFMGLIKK